MDQFQNDMADMDWNGIVDLQWVLSASAEMDSDFWIPAERRSPDSNNRMVTDAD